MADTKTVYVLCSVQKLDSANDKVHYVPLVRLYDNMRKINFAASLNLVSLQRHYIADIAKLATSGISIIAVPLTLEKFKELSKYAASRLTIIINAYMDVVDEYKETMMILGEDKINDDLAFDIYNSIVCEEVPCVLDENMEIVDLGKYDVSRGVLSSFESLILRSSEDDAKELADPMEALGTCDSDFRDLFDSCLDDDDCPDDDDDFGGDLSECSA